MLALTYSSCQWSLGKLRSPCSLYSIRYSSTGGRLASLSASYQGCNLRTTGKFSYQLESSYSVGTVGYEDVDCERIDHTYIRTASSGLDTLLRREVAAFTEELKKSPGLRSGQISLEFFQRKRTRWPFPPENIPWEVNQNKYKKLK